MLGWPWEALHDPQVGQLAQTCQIERRLNTVRKPDKVGQRWPEDQVNILLVTARPYAADVLYRSISRPLVELIDKHDLPAQVTVLRPPTFESLQEHLRERPNHYHIVHFDGHGSYGQAHAPSGGPLMLQGPEGQLIFEEDDGKPDPITAEQLSVLLRQHHIPVIVLNACQSAMVDQGAKDPFASVATALLKSGIRSVVAMAYSLYVSGAQEFLPAFYRDLFRTGNVAQAARAGRQRMFEQKNRVWRGACIRSTIGWSPLSISKSPWTSRSRPKPRRPRPTAVPNFQERPAIRRTPTASSAATGPCWRWSAPCAARPRAC